MTLAREQSAYLQRRSAERAAVERRSKLKHTYDITPEQYDEMLAAQGGVCAICKQPETLVDPKKGPRRLAVDHNHTTGANRGLLCANCNNGLGRFDDSVERLLSAVAYLSGHVG